MSDEPRLVVRYHPDDTRGSATGRRAEAPGTYRLVAQGPDLLVLRRDGAPEPDPQRVMVAGEILGDSTILDTLSLIGTSRWVGAFHVYGEDSHRTLGFDRGALCWASSDHPHDRLDRVLFRMDVLRPSTAETVMRQLEPGQRFGQVLVERGVVDRPQLFRCLQEQMRQILFSAVLEPSGCFMFLAPGSDGEPPSVIAHLPVQELLLPAASRIDALKTYRVHIPSDDLCPEADEDLELADLDPQSRLLVGHCDGRRTIRELASETWLGGFRVLQVVDRLLRDGKISLRMPPRPRLESVGRMVQPYSAAMRWIFHEARNAGILEHLRGELGPWIEQRPESELLEAIIEPDGTISRMGVLAWMQSHELRDRSESVQAALRELVSFALFVVSDRLRRDVGRDLTRRVGSCLQDGEIPS